MFENEILAVVYEYDLIDIWDLNSKSRKQEIHIGYENLIVSSLSFDNHQLITGFRDGAILILNIDDHQFECLTNEIESNDELRSLLLLHNGLLLSFYSKEIRIWNVEARTCVETLSDDRFFYINPDLTVAVGGAKFACAIKNTICIWNSNELECELIGHTKRITTLKCLGTSMLASGSEDKTIRIWQINASGVGECLETIKGHTNYIEALMLFGEDRLASAANGENNVRVWDFNIRQKSITFYTILYDAQIFTSVGDDKIALVSQNIVRVWNVFSDAKVYDLNSFHGKRISLLQSHGDSTLIGVVDSTITIWNVHTYQPLHVLKDQHCNEITSLLVLSSIEFITGSLDGKIRVWHVTRRGVVLFEHSELTSQRILSLDSLHNDTSHFLVLSEGRSDKTMSVIQRKEINSFKVKGSYTNSSLESIYFFFE